MKNKTALRLMALIGTVCGVIMLFGNIPTHYTLLPYLALFSSMVFLVSSVLIGNSSVSVSTVLIFGMTVMRYCLHPLIMVYGDYQTVLKYNISSNAQSGILLMMYECVAIYLAMVASIRKNRLADNNSSNIVVFKRIHTVVFLLFGYLALALAVRPDLSNLFMSIFQIDEVEFTQAGRIEGQQEGSFLRIISTLFSFVFLIVRIVFPVYILGLLIKKKKSNTVLISATLLFVFLQFLFITATFAESIIASLIIILAVGKSDKRLFAKMMKIAPLFVVGIIIAYFYIRHQVNAMAGTGGKYAGNNTLAELSSLINAYFTGVDNVAGTFNLRRDSRLEHFLASMQVTIPFNTTIFGRAGEILPTLFNFENHETGQIPSTIGNGYYYFGFLLAPIFSFSFSYLAVKFNAIALNTQSFWHYVTYMLVAVLFSLGLGMYNEVITIQYIFNWAIPMLLIANYLNRSVHNSR